MSGVSSRLDYRYLHPGVFEPVERELGQGGPDATALVVGVNSQHGDLTHVALGIINLNRPPLIFSPVRMQSPENLGAQHLLKRREDRRPCPQREVNYRVGVSIFKWSNPWLHRFTSRYPATKYCI